MDGEHGGEREFNPLEPAGFEFALEFEAGRDDLDGHDDGGVRAAQEFGEENARLAEALVVALKAGEDQVEIFRLEGRGHGTGRGQRVELEEFRVGDVDAAIGAFGQGFLDGLLDAIGAHGNGYHFAVVLFLEAEGFFEGVGVGLVGFKAYIRFADPGAALRRWREEHPFAGTCLTQTPIFKTELLECRVHKSTQARVPVPRDYLPSQRLKTRDALVPPKPKEFERT